MKRKKKLQLQEMLRQKSKATDCELDNDNDDIDATRIYEFTGIPSYVSVITFSLSEPVYTTKIFEKGQASEVMSDRYGHKILAKRILRSWKLP